MKRLTALSLLAGLLVVAPHAFARTGSQASTTVRVTAKEFKFTLSRKSAPHGVVIFKVTNKGKIKHDFKIAGKKTPLIAAGKSATLKVTLKKGSYKYICTVPTHAALGMKGTFKVT
ncbi:MAG TPA: plastocyanin/azurin family copper-binding protein [Gaiellaceae bacterium]